MLEHHKMKDGEGKQEVSKNPEQQHGHECCVQSQIATCNSVPATGKSYQKRPLNLKFQLVLYILCLRK